MLKKPLIIKILFKKSTEETKLIAFYCKQPVREQIVSNNCDIEPVKVFFIYDMMWIVIMIII